MNHKRFIRFNIFSDRHLDLLQAHDNVSMILNRCNEGDRLTASGYYGYGYGYYRKRSELNVKEKNS